MSATADVTPASSTGTEAPAVTYNADPETFTAEQHREWMEKGTLPESVPGSTPDAQEPAAAEEHAETDTESAPVVQQEKKGKNADTRKAQLHAEIQDLLKQRRELQAELETTKAVKPAAPAPAKSEKAERPKNPVFGEPGHDNESWEQFEARRESYIEQLTEYKTRAALAEMRAEEAKHASETQKAEQNALIERSWQSRVEQAQKNHADFAEVAFSKDVPISPTMDAYILKRPAGPEVLYYLGKNPDLAREIADMEPVDAAYMLTKIELSLADEKLPASPTTKAARPATNLQAVNGGAVDELAEAVAAGDQIRFNEIQNRRQLERRKRG